MKPAKSTVVKKRKKKPEEIEKLVSELVERLGDSVEEIVNAQETLGVTIEEDYRGYTTTLTVRIHKDRGGGVLKRHTYKRQGRK